MAAFITTAFYEPVTVTGVVMDVNGSLLVGVSVIEKGTRNGTTTDQNGKFSIKVSGPNAVLQVSGAGFETKDVKLKSQTAVSVTLKALESHLSEVVVIGYGTTSDAGYYFGPSHKELKKQQLAAAKGESRALSAPKFFSQEPLPCNTEDYDGIIENRFRKSTDEPLSTFSIDVDGASYSNVRRIINLGGLPPAGAVRIEEFVNYFQYKYVQPKGNDPFSINTEIAACPWNTQHRLVMIGLQGKEIEKTNLPPCNLVFLIDVSGSMQDENKLPLVKVSLKLLVDQLREQDRVAIVVYAGAAGLVLPSTGGEDKDAILDAIENLEAGGSTAGGAGIKLAYKVANEQFKKTGNNRVILCTDGDFNVGASSDDEMEKLIEKERQSGVFLTVLGYGMGNYKDNKMQKLANKGNGNHAYIDGLSEAKKVLVNEFGGTMFTIAKDVKLQVEFNPSKVQAYRLIGYENRMLNKEDFNNDAKDAGELGSGHTVTALYEIIPVGVESKFIEKVDPLKYQNVKETKQSSSNEMLTIKFRYKKPGEDVSNLMEHAVTDNHILLEKTSENFRFASAVAEFGLLLRNSEFRANASYENVLQRSSNALGNDEEGYRSEFVKLVKNTRLLARKKARSKENLVTKEE